MLIQKKTCLMPIGTPFPDRTRLNFDGLLTLSNPDDAISQSYVQTFRRGAIEAVSSSITESGGSVNIRRVGHYIVEYGLQYEKILNECGAGLPMATLSG
jgi:hypothetical protein